jgi:hypothetical protein
LSPLAVNARARSAEPRHLDRLRGLPAAFFEVTLAGSGVPPFRARFGMPSWQAIEPGRKVRLFFVADEGKDLGPPLPINEPQLSNTSAIAGPSVMSQDIPYG